MAKEEPHVIKTETKNVKTLDKQPKTSKENEFSMTFLKQVLISKQKHKSKIDLKEKEEKKEKEEESLFEGMKPEKETEIEKKAEPETKIELEKKIDLIKERLEADIAKVTHGSELKPFTIKKEEKEEKAELEERKQEEILESGEVIEKKPYIRALPKLSELPEPPIFKRPKIQQPVISKPFFYGTHVPRVYMPETRKPSFLAIPPIDLGKLNHLIVNPSVTVIQCNGAQIPLKIKKEGRIQKTEIILNENEIKNIIEKFASKSGQTPSGPGKPVFKTQVNNLTITATTSEFGASRFVISKV